MFRKVSRLVAPAVTLLAPLVAYAGELPIEGTPITKDTLTDFVEGVATFVLEAAAVIVVIFIVYGGIKMASSAGNATKFEEGKKIVINAVIGAAVIFGIGVIISTIAGFSKDPNSVFQGGPL